MRGHEVGSRDRAQGQPTSPAWGSTLPLGLLAGGTGQGLEDTPGRGSWGR